MQHFPQIVALATSDKPQISKMVGNESERLSQTWLEDLATSDVAGKEMTSGLFRMNKGNPLQYTYTYEEIKYIVDGVFHLTDGTGQTVVAQAGDLMYFPAGSRITFDTPSTALGCFCGQRRFGEEETNPAEAATLGAINPPMVHYPGAASLQMPIMCADQSQQDSKTWFGDVALSEVPGKELAAGFFHMKNGKALDYYYDYEEMKFIVSGVFHLTDGTGQQVVAQAGDLMYFPKGSSIRFDTPSEALGCFCGQRLVEELVTHL